MHSDCETSQVGLTAAFRLPLTALRVLHVIPTVAKRYGGPSTAIFPMCRALNAAGCDARICTTTADGQQHLDVETGRFIDYEGVETIFFAARGGEFKYSRQMAEWLNAHVKDFDLVHIHAVFNYSSIAAARACRKHSIPYIVRPLGTLDPWSMRQKPLKKTLFWRSFGKQMLEGAAAVHYTTDGEKRAVETTLNVNHGIVVPLGVDLPSASHLPLTADSLITHHSKTPYILFLSRLVPGKGLEVLIEAFASVVDDERFTNWKLLIAGDGEQHYFNSLRELVSRCDVDDSVEFLGWLDQKAKFGALSGASLFALPSHHENFGISAIEAMACEVPVLVTSCMNIAKDVGTSNAGWIGETDLSSLKLTLRSALESESERRKRGASAAHLASGYSSRMTTPQLIEMYKKAAVGFL